jgi:hypothetical protein
LTTHARAAIRDPAKRVLQLLGFAATSADAAAPVAAAPAAAPVANLLDFDDNTEPTAAPPAPVTPPAAVAAGGGGSLFGGLKVQGGVAPAAAPPTAPSTAPPPAPTSGNLLDAFMTNDAPAAAPAGGDMFGEMNVKENAAPPAAPAPTPPASASSMFDNMSLKSPVPAATAAAAVDEHQPVALAGSAFGFMNSSSSMDAPATPVPAAAVSFDPLKNVTPNTAKQMMQLSPQQMQAMAYQQMMMQQQMQMSQMMAMQQQQQQRGGGGGAVPGTNNFMQVPYLGQHNGVVMQNPAAAKTSFAFIAQPQKKDDKSFDFIKDTMKMQKK